MNEYWYKDTHMTHLMLNTRKHKGEKNDLKLLQSVNQVNRSTTAYGKPVDLLISRGQHFTDIQTSNPSLGDKRNIYVNCPRQILNLYSSIISQMKYLFHYLTRNIMGKRFLRFNLNKCTRMYNMCWDTIRKISAATYHKYKPKTVKLQDRIPFRPSCCERCQNFENILNEASKYMVNIPSDVGDAIDLSMCPYTGFFPDIKCILCICDKCGTSKYKDLILKKKCK